VAETADAGTDLFLGGIVEPPNATKQTIVWSIKAPGATGATIEGRTLKTTAAGAVTVTATVAGGLVSGAYAKDFAITVSHVAVSNISGVAETADAGTDLFLGGIVEPPNATKQTIVWSIKAPGSTGATIEDGILKTTGTGTVQVTATIEDGLAAAGAYTKDFTLTVKYDAVTGITGVASATNARTDLVLNGTVEPANASDKTIVWSIKDVGTTGATIEGRTLKTTAAGTVKVTATIARGTSLITPYTKDFDITVTVAITGITGVAKGANVGTDLPLNGIVAPADATNQTITWIIKDARTTGATIVGGNTLKTTGAGTATVTATIVNGLPMLASDYTQDFDITVTVAATGITDIAATIVSAGTDLTLDGTVEPADATNQAIIWSVKTAGTTGATIVGGNTLKTTGAGTVVVTGTVTDLAKDYTKDFTITVYEALSGTKWYWGEVVLTFTDNEYALINSLGWTTSTPGYSYDYDFATRSGFITGDLNRRNGNPPTSETYINDPGPFTIALNGSFLATLTFSSYRESGTAITFTRSYTPINHDLIGVIWYGPNFLIECLDEDDAILYALDGYYTTTTKLKYTYDSITKSGGMIGVLPAPLNGNPGPFTIIENSPFFSDGTGGDNPWYASGYIDDWDWRGGPKRNFIAAYHMAFANWKNYGHGWDMVKLDENGIEIAP
jgi:hypothetical protein